MPTISDSEVQARLLREIIEVSDKKRKLEEHLRIVDERNKLLCENAARKDIEEYHKRSLARSSAAERQASTTEQKTNAAIVSDLPNSTN